MQYDWTTDPRVKPLLERMAKRPPAMESYQDWSDSSWGKKTYFRYTGARYRELCAIRDEYIDRAFAVEDTDPQACRIAMDAPYASDLVDYLLGRYVDYRGSNRDEYLAKCKAAMPDMVLA